MLNTRHKIRWAGAAAALLILAGALAAFGAGQSAPVAPTEFPRSLESYGDGVASGLWAVLAHRARQEPFNLLATVIFLCAIIHTFLTSRFLAIAHRWEDAHDERLRRGEAEKHSVHIGAELFHFFGEIEVVFGLWAAALTGAIFLFYDWHTLLGYITHKVNFTEALFVVVIMTLASTRPILKLTELIMAWIARLFGGTLKAWWMTILTLGPILGSLITEPAAMTICALLLARKFYSLGPSRAFKYATIGLLFVNISIGGTLSHFAAPPVLMVAGPWQWDMVHMLTHFGWKAVLAILISNGFYFFVFRKELSRLQEAFNLVRLKDEIQKHYIQRNDFEAEFDKMGCLLSDELGFRMAVENHTRQIKENIERRLREKYADDLNLRDLDPALVREAFEQRFEEIKRQNLRRTIPGVLPEDQRPQFRDPEWDDRDDAVPAWVIVVHLLFMAWTIANAHHPAIFVPSLLFFLGFAEVTRPFQNSIDLKPPLLVGFFLGGLVIHGGVQGWWIAPVLSSLGEVPLMLGATVLTAFNDNAAITFLSTLVPNFTDPLKYAVVAGAVAGGGLTVIANAPNPAGQAILKKYFDDGLSPLMLLAGALAPTIIVLACFLIFR
ncbi:MAG: putative Na+/H+ antiporter [Pseudomonadota bacterium]